MNGELKPSRPHLFATVIAAVGALLIVGALIWITVRITRPPAVGAARAQERKAALAQVRQDEAQILNHNAPLGSAPGFARITISNAMALVLRDYQQDPKKARAELTARADKAGTPPPAPVNQYE